MQSTPIICGIDIGSWTLKISSYNGQQFEVLTNEANFRQTPTLVGFTKNQRLIGEAAMIKLKSNFMNTVRAPLRLLGIQNRRHLLEEQLSYGTVKYQLKDQLEFLVEWQGQKIKVCPQQLLMALMGKIKQIVESHGLTIFASYIATPCFLSQEERISIKRCAESVGVCQVINLIEDWECLGAQYSFSRVKDLKSLTDFRFVVFIDVGFSKVTIFLMQFGQNQGRLIDSQHLRYTGSKNMDGCLLKFYDKIFQETAKVQSLLKNPKAYVKLAENIQKQRKVLSANLQHQLSIEYLLEEQHLNYNMSREQFQNLIMPVLAEMAAAMQNLKSRNSHVVLHSVQLVGGTSRIPFLQNMVANIFGKEPSKTLNQSEAVSVGASIFGAQQSKWVPNAYDIVRTNNIEIAVCWAITTGQKLLGQEIKLYSQKKVLFEVGSRIPSDSFITLESQGIVQLCVYYQKKISSKAICYSRIKTPNKVLFHLDQDKIVNLKLAIGYFQYLDMHELKQDNWQKMRLWEEEMQRADQRISTIYQLKNQFQSRLYANRSKLMKYMNSENNKEVSELFESLESAQDWIQSQNNRRLGSQEDLQLYISKLKEMDSIKQKFAVFDSRRRVGNRN